MLSTARQKEADPIHTGIQQTNRVALLLAGGDGMRLRELTRQITGLPMPKQYCPLLPGASLLEATVARAQLFTTPDRISVVVNQDHLFLATRQLKVLPESNVLVQPLNRDTGPGMIFALQRLRQMHDDPVVAVFPTDHYVDNDRMFIRHVLRAVGTVTQMPDKIAILGIAPDRPETGYGYMLPADRLGIFGSAYSVESFTEKPDLIGAKDIISRGGLWNTFVMVFRLSRMMELLCDIVPEECARFMDTDGAPAKVEEVYPRLDSWNLSTQVLARIPQHLVMLEVSDVRWSDWGTRESVERTYRSLNMVPFWNVPDSFGALSPGCFNPD